MAGAILYLGEGGRGGDIKRISAEEGKMKQRCQGRQKKRMRRKTHRFQAAGVITGRQAH